MYNTVIKRNVDFCKELLTVRSYTVTLALTMSYVNYGTYHDCIRYITLANTLRMDDTGGLNHVHRET